MTEVTQMLDAIAGGDRQAAEQLLPLVYDELRRLAAQRLAQEQPGQTLQATALVHEAYLRLTGSDAAQQWDGRGHFFAAAAEAMRRILIDNARRRKRLKRGGDRARVDLDQVEAAASAPGDDLLDLDEALVRLGRRIRPRLNSSSCGFMRAYRWKRRRSAWASPAQRPTVTGLTRALGSTTGYGKSRRSGKEGDRFIRSSHTATDMTPSTRLVLIRPFPSLTLGPRRRDRHKPAHLGYYRCLMAQPEKLRIACEDDDDGCFDAVGRLPDGTQFMAYVTGAFPTGLKYYSGEDWQTKKKWLAVIHRFDADGNHLGSESRLGGLDSEGREVAGDKAFAHLQAMFAELCAGRRPEFCDIWVKLFSAEIDGVTYGLFYEHFDEEAQQGRNGGEWVILEPRDIMFHPPWHSSGYST